jgi:methylmalonyl-CoA/ethylmalonyl-CoA epimerase
MRIKKGGIRHMLKKLGHIGIMVTDLDRAIEKFKGFGLPCTEILESKKLGHRTGILSIGDTSIELICDTEPVLDDPMVRVVMGQKGVINHLCFEVDDLETSIKKFEKNGAKLVESCPRPGGHGRIAFFYPETTEGVLIELCEV